MGHEAWNNRKHVHFFSRKEDIPEQTMKKKSLKANISYKRV